MGCLSHNSPPSSCLAALGAAGLRLDPWSDLLRRKSSSRTGHDQMEPPPCKEQSSPAPPCILRTGSRISVLLDKAPKCLSSVCSLEAAWQGGMGRQAAGTFADATASFTRGHCNGIKIAVACDQSISMAAMTAIQPPGLEFRSAGVLPFPVRNSLFPSSHSQFSVCTAFSSPRHHVSQ